MEAHLHMNEETGTDLKNVSESVPVHYSVNLYVPEWLCVNVRVWMCASAPVCVNL